MTAYEILLVLLALIVGAAAGYQWGWVRSFEMSTHALERALDQIRDEQHAVQKTGD